MQSFDLKRREKFLRPCREAVWLGVFFVGTFFLPHISFAATLSITPAASSRSVEQTFTESVLVDAGGQAINAVSGTISFPPSTLQVISISESSSIVNFWATNPSFSNASGTISFEGVILNPGFSGSAGNIITVTFQAKAAGQSPLSFTAGSVLANDGQGTNVLSAMTGAAVSIVSTGNESGLSSVPSVNPLAPPAPQITSPTNPDPDGWSATSSPSFSWPVSSDVTAARVLYDTDPTSVPTVLYTPAISSKTLNGLADGTYYFHVQLENANGWGGISHYRFQIDTAPPDPFVISFPNGATSSVPAQIIAFKAEDGLSGIDHYSIQIDNQAPFSIPPSDAGSSYALPAEPLGLHTLIITAYDMAGNSTVATADFYVSFVAPPTATSIFLKIGGLIINYASVALIAVLILALLVGVFWRTVRKISTLKKQVKREVGQAEDILHRSFDLLKEDVSDHIRLLLKAQTRRALTREEELFLKKFGSNLAEAEKIISKEMRNLEDLK